MLSDGILACRAQKELEAERQARLDSEASAAALKEQLQKARADAEDNQRDALQQIQVLQQQIQNIQATHHLHQLLFASFLTADFQLFFANILSTSGSKREESAQLCKGILLVCQQTAYLVWINLEQMSIHVVQ